MNEMIGCGLSPRHLTESDERITAELSVADFFRIRSVGTRADVRILKKCGLAFCLRRLRRRYVFAAGLALCALVFAVGSRFIWTVSYEGVENCDITELKAAAELAGLKEGAYKGSLKPGLEMKNIILNNTDGICWVWVYVKGTRAVVKVREEIIPPEVFDPDVPCDIIAARNGIIKRVTARRGKCVVTANQAVAAGDTLISGTAADADSNGKYPMVHASGEAEAYTEHTKTGVFKQIYRYRRYTGKRRRFLTLRVFGREISLRFGKTVPFDKYETEYREKEVRLFRDFCTGIGIAETEYREYVEESEPVPYDTAAEFAERKLEKDISRELLPGAVLLDRKLDVNRTDGETISVTLTMNFVEKIGTEKQIEEVTFIEPKTN